MGGSATDIGGGGGDHLDGKVGEGCEAWVGLENLEDVRGRYWCSLLGWLVRGDDSGAGDTSEEENECGKRKHFEETVGGLYGSVLMRWLFLSVLGGDPARIYTVVVSQEALFETITPPLW